MRIAWFGPRSSHDQHGVADPLDDTAGLIAALGPQYSAERFDARSAHDFVWRHARDPFDVCIYDLSDTPDHAFLWPYLIHYPGILRLRAPSLHRSRADALQSRRQADDYTAEVAFSGRRMLGAPVLASHMVVVANPDVAQALQGDFPHARVRVAPIGIAAPEALPGIAERHDARGADAPTVVALLDALRLDTSRLDVVRRAARRARDAGAAVTLLADAPPMRVLREADVVLAVRWPPDGEPPIAALLGLSAGLPVVLFDEAVTAEWPTLDPQTWLPRNSPPAEPPIAVAIDPRDEEHSLMLAMRRLAADPALRAELGAAAQVWWRAHGTPARAADAWRTILDEAATLRRAERMLRGRTPGVWRMEPGAGNPQPAWPAHLRADGSGTARDTLAAFGVSTDLL